MKILMIIFLPLALFCTDKTLTQNFIHSQILVLLVVGISLGIIIMAAIYNGAFYYYNKENSFLYYTIMQIGMISVLLYDTGIVHLFIPSQTVEGPLYEFISLFTLYFIIKFSRSFLNTPTFLTLHDSILKAFSILLLIDAIYTPYSLILNTGLFLLLFIYLPFLGYKRVQQYDKSAYFFLIGWGVFLISILLDGIFYNSTKNNLLTFNPMFIGSISEAIMLAAALSFQLKILKEEQIQQQQLLIHQSKLAAMGELLGSIAHQWKQPLTRLSYTLMNIEISSDKDMCMKLVNEGNKHIEYMSQTIEDFRHFYAPTKEKESFKVSQACQEILDIFNDENIQANIIIDNDKILYSYKHEFKQVLYNLLNNAKELIITRSIQPAEITIIIQNTKLTIEDNAGGIQIKPIEKIFEPYFTTKESGTGIGLYMSKIIIEKNIGGYLDVTSCKGNTTFTISYPKS